MQIVAVTDDQGVVVEPEWVRRAEPVHRQLRPMLPADYAGRLAEVFRSGARMCVAVEGDKVLGVALWRVIENTYEGRRCYVDDLVTDERHRSQGVGKALLGYLESGARKSDCNVLALSSGVQRSDAHRFYFREGMHIPSFDFRKNLT
jgi:GNAT superfamily N-acetyltransferase